MLTTYKLTLFRVGLFGLLTNGGGAKSPHFRLSRICHTQPTLMKLGTVIPYLKKIQKHINHVIHPLSSADIRIFSPKINNFCCIRKRRYRLHFNAKFLILLTSFESLKFVLINMVAILMRSAKLATLDLLEIRVF